MLTRVVPCLSVLCTAVHMLPNVHMLPSVHMLPHGSDHLRDLCISDCLRQLCEGSEAKGQREATRRLERLPDFKTVRRVPVS